MNILITGVGGPAGICFARSLSEIKEINLIGANAEKEAVGKKFVKKFYKLPFANKSTFINEINKIIMIKECIIPNNAVSPKSMTDKIKKDFFFVVNK